MCACISQDENPWYKFICSVYVGYKRAEYAGLHIDVYGHFGGVHVGNSEGVLAILLLCILCIENWVINPITFSHLKITSCWFIGFFLFMFMWKALFGFCPFQMSAVITCCSVFILSVSGECQILGILWMIILAWRIYQI